MILADKIIGLRKKNGWSQEELAYKMNVSRQAISKWERAQTISDLEKILQLSVLFCVATDYLLKDEIEDEEFTTDTSSDTIVKRISIEEANEYIEQRKKASWRLALATFLCIISPITIVVLSILAELPNPIVTEAIAGAVGITVLFGFVFAQFLFIFTVALRISLMRSLIKIFLSNLSMVLKVSLLKRKTTLDLLMFLIT